LPCARQRPPPPSLRARWCPPPPQMRAWWRRPPPPTRARRRLSPPLMCARRRPPPGTSRRGAFRGGFGRERVVEREGIRNMRGIRRGC
jgi:hypothetical protein